MKQRNRQTLFLNQSLTKNTIALSVVLLFTSQHSWVDAKNIKIHAPSANVSVGPGGVSASATPPSVDMTVPSLPTLPDAPSVNATVETPSAPVLAPSVPDTMAPPTLPEVTVTTPTTDPVVVSADTTIAAPPDLPALPEVPATPDVPAVSASVNEVAVSVPTPAVQTTIQVQPASAGRLGPVLKINGASAGRRIPIRVEPYRPDRRVQQAGTIDIQQQPTPARISKPVRVTRPVANVKSRQYYTPNIDNMSGGVDIKDLSPNAPSVYTVKRGDTLWKISRMYLRKPWRWPELWRGNRDHITNPHLIYPGQKIYLSVRDGKAYLSGSPDEKQASKAETVVVTPETNQVKTQIQSLDAQAVPAFMGIDALARFAKQPVVVDPTSYANAPWIVTGHDGRNLYSLGDRAYVKGALTAGQNYRLYDNFSAVIDPDTKQTIGYQADYVGDGQAVRGTDGAGASTLVITNAKREISSGARLLVDQPGEPFPVGGFSPGTVDGGKIAFLKNLQNEYPNLNAELNVAVFTRGSSQGVQPGQIYLIYHPTQQFTRVDPVKEFEYEQKGVHFSSVAKDTIDLAPEAYSHMYVFKTGPNFAYGVVLDGEHEIELGDLVKPAK